MKNPINIDISGQTENTYIYVYYNGTLTEERSFYALEGDTFEIWNLGCSWDLTVEGNSTIKDFIESDGVAYSTSGKMTIKFSFNDYDLYNRLISKAAEIDKTVLLPIGIEVTNEKERSLSFMRSNLIKYSISENPIDLYFSVVTSYEYAMGCYKLFRNHNIKYLVLNINAEYNISYCFCDCASLEEVKIKNLSACKASYLFSNDTALRSVEIDSNGKYTPLVSTNQELLFRDNWDFLFNNCKLLANTVGHTGIEAILTSLNLRGENTDANSNYSFFMDCPYNKTVPAELYGYMFQKPTNTGFQICTINNLPLYVDVETYIKTGQKVMYSDIDTSTDIGTIVANYTNQANALKYDNSFNITCNTKDIYAFKYILRNVKAIWHACALDTDPLCFNINYIDNSTESTTSGDNAAALFNSYIKEEIGADDNIKITLTCISAKSCKDLFNGVSTLYSISIPSAIKVYSNIIGGFANCPNISYVSGTFFGVANEIFYGSFKNTTPKFCQLIFYGSCVRAFATSYISDFSEIAFNTSDLTQVFYKCPNITKVNTNFTFRPFNRIIKEAFAECPNLVNVEGDWVDPNSSLYYQNYVMDSVTSKNVATFNDPTTKSGFSIPSSVTDAYGLFRDCPKLTTVKNLKLSTGINDWAFQNDTALKTLENVYLNESGSYTGIFDGAAQNSTWKIWRPKYVKDKEPYNIGSDNIFGTALDPEKVPVLWVDDGYITIKNEFIDVQSLRRLNYINIVDPDKKYAWKFFTHPYILTAEHFGYNKMKETQVYYRNNNN